MQSKSEKQIAVLALLFILAYTQLIYTASALTLTDVYISETEGNIITGDCIPLGFNQIAIYDQNSVSLPYNLTDCQYEVQGQSFSEGQYMFIDTGNENAITNDCEFLSLSDCLRIHPLSSAQAYNLNGGILKSIPNSVMGSFQGSEMLASVASGVKDTGLTLWVIVALAIAIPLTFWAIRKIMDIFKRIREEDRVYSRQYETIIKRNDELMDETEKLLKKKR